MVSGTRLIAQLWKKSNSNAIFWELKCSAKISPAALEMLTALLPLAQLVKLGKEYSTSTCLL